MTWSNGQSNKFKSFVYYWSGHSLVCNEGKSIGVGKWNGLQLEWYRSEEEEQPAISYLYSPKHDSYHYLKGDFSEDEMPDFNWSRNFLVPTNNEGHFSVDGSVPKPLALLAVLFSKLI